MTLLKPNLIKFIFIATLNTRKLLSNPPLTGAGRGGPLSNPNQSHPKHLLDNMLLSALVFFPVIM